MNYAPESAIKEVACEPGELMFAAVNLNHGHITGMTKCMIDAGATLKWVYDSDPKRVEAFRKTFPQAKPARSLDEVLEDPEIKLVNAAAIANERGPLGVKVMRAGKDYFTDKTPFTTLSQVEDARKAAAETGQKYIVYYSERIGVEAAVLAERMINDGAIGKVVGMQGFGPHRVGAPEGRPDWFYRKEQYGGILCDIGSHHCDQFLAFSGATDGQVLSARTANVRFKQFPELEDYGEALIEGDNGASMYIRVDWLTPEGLPTWGDGRSFIIGTEGYIEIRKYVNLSTQETEPSLFLVNQKETREYHPKGKIGLPFFAAFARDILNRTETAMTQAHAFKAGELCVRMQAMADGLRMRDV